MNRARWPFARSVKGDIMTGATLLIVAIGVMAMGHIHGGLASLLRGELTHRGLAIGDLAAETGTQLLLTGDEFALHHLLRDTVERNPDVSYVYVKDAAGRVRAHSFPHGFPTGLSGVHQPASVRGMRLIDTPEEGRIQDVSVPLMGGRLGSVHVGMRQARVHRRIASLVLAWGLTAIALLAGGLAAAWWLTSRFARRIDRLIAAAEEVGSGNLSAAPADGGTDEIGRLAEAFRRMTADLKRSQDQLLRAGRLAAIGELASGVAHEINNPLATMGVCCQSLLERARGERLRAMEEFADFPEYLASIQEEVQRCRKITGSLLDFARAREPSREAVDVNEVVRGALPLAALRHKGAEPPFELALAEGLPPVLGDPDQLRQVALNLLINALDPLPPGGAVRVATSRRNGSVTLTVSDDGPGIAPEHMARLFEPFFTTKRAGQGTGLGLAVCRRIVEAHGGRVEAANGPARGATFTVTLPAEEPDA